MTSRLSRQEGAGRAGAASVQWLGVESERERILCFGGEQDVVTCVRPPRRCLARGGSACAPGPFGGAGAGIPPEVAGIAVNAAGTRLLAANYENDSISVVDLGTRAKIAETGSAAWEERSLQKGHAGRRIPVLGAIIKGTIKPTSPAFATEKSWSWHWRQAATRHRTSSHESPCAGRRTR